MSTNENQKKTSFYGLTEQEAYWLIERTTGMHRTLQTRTEQRELLIQSALRLLKRVYELEEERYEIFARGFNHHGEKTEESIRTPYNVFSMETGIPAELISVSWEEIAEEIKKRQSQKGG